MYSGSLLWYGSYFTCWSDNIIDIFYLLICKSHWLAVFRFSQLGTEYSNGSFLSKHNTVHTSLNTFHSSKSDKCLYLIRSSKKESDLYILCKESLYYLKSGSYYRLIYLAELYQCSHRSAVLNYFTESACHWNCLSVCWGVSLQSRNKGCLS